MNFVSYYDDYWRQADDTFDMERLALLSKHVQAEENVLEVDCGPGVLAAQMRDKGANVTATDLSSVAVARAQAKGIACRQVVVDAEPLPFEDEDSAHGFPGVDEESPVGLDELSLLRGSDVRAAAE